MKRIFCLFIVISLVMACLNGCGLMLALYETDEEIEQAQMDAVLSALQEQDADALKALFCQYTLSEATNFDQTIDNLFAYFQGTVTSTYSPGSHTSREREEGKEKRDLYLSYDVTTTDQVYRIAIHYCVTNDNAPQQEGIVSLYIIKMAEDTDPQYAYHGDGAYTPGIQIGVPNKLPTVVDGTVPYV